MSCNEIYKFRKDIYGNEIYKNAISRILIISDGDDVCSDSNAKDIVQELIRNKIIVDSIFINIEDDCNMLAAVCHATGGIAYKVTEVDGALSLIEKSAFFNIKERKFHSQPLIEGDMKTFPSLLKPEQITEDFLSRASDCAKLDTDVQNKQHIQKSINEFKLITPRNVCGIDRDKFIEYSRIRRVLRELHNAAQIMNI